MPSIIPTSIKLADRHNGPYALRRSVNFVFLLLARQNKLASFALARASVRRFSQYYHTRQDDGSLSIGDNPMVGATVAIAGDIAGALSK